MVSWAMKAGALQCPVRRPVLSPCGLQHISWYSKHIRPHSQILQCEILPRLPWPCDPPADHGSLQSARPCPSHHPTLPAFWWHQVSTLLALCQDQVHHGTSTSPATEPLPTLMGVTLSATLGRTGLCRAPAFDAQTDHSLPSITFPSLPFGICPTRLLDLVSAAGLPERVGNSIGVDVCFWHLEGKLMLVVACGQQLCPGRLWLLLTHPPLCRHWQPRLWLPDSLSCLSAAFLLSVWNPWLWASYPSISRLPTYSQGGLSEVS